MQIVQTEPQQLSDTTEQVSTESESTELASTKPEQPKHEIEAQEDINETHSRGKEPVLAKYVRRHHAPDQIIGDKLKGTMTRSKVKCTCLFLDFDPKVSKMH